MKKQRAKKTLSAKVFVLVAALFLVCGSVVGGTLAWLISTPDSVENTFTIGNIEIELTETGAVKENTTDTILKKEYDFVPGDKLIKDPVVTVNKDSEACWLFIHVEEKNNIYEGLADKIIQYNVADGWSAVTGHDGYWYRDVNTVAKDTPFNVFTGDENVIDATNNTGKNGIVTVNENITKEMVEGITAAKPVITITAAAIQKDNVIDVSDAWAKLFGSN